ncbi:MAG: hypothetical protein AAGC71_14070, partial [Pseudomonadota bacterium]
MSSAVDRGGDAAPTWVGVLWLSTVWERRLGAMMAVSMQSAVDRGGDAAPTWVGVLWSASWR